MPDETKPWYEGLPTEDVAHAQVRGWDKLPVDQVAAEAVKAHRNAEGLLRGPANETFRIPANAKPEELAPVFSRLGVPEKPEDYSVDGLGFETPEMTTKFADTVRKTAFENHIPKQAAETFAKNIWGLLDAEGAAEAKQLADNLAAEQAKLNTAWGTQKDANMAAVQTAVKAFLPPGADSTAILKSLEATAGFANTLQFLHQVGVKMGEDSLVTGGGSTAASTLTPQSIEQAWTRRQEMIHDTEFSKKLEAGDPAAKREWDDVIHRIADARNEGWRPTPGAAGFQSNMPPSRSR